MNDFEEQSNRAEKNDSFVEEKSQEILVDNLELGESANEIIDRARDLIETRDEDGSKTKIFNEALNYYSQKQETLANVPIYHSTGSYGLINILHHGALESRINTATGEQVTTGEESDTTSFVVGGYNQSETVSYFYARKNEKQSTLVLDKEDITGVGCEDDIVREVFSELPKLEGEEQEWVKSAIKKIKGDRKISNEELMSEKMKELQERKYNFDVEEEKKRLLELEEERKSAPEDKRWEIDQKITKLKKRIRIYEQEPLEVQEEMSNPFPVILTYEGENLPSEDLTNLTSGLVSERRTKQSIENSLLKQIQVTKNEINKVNEWIEMAIDSLPEDSPERKAMSDIEVIPLEYFEAKNIIRFVKNSQNSEVEL